MRPEWIAVIVILSVCLVVFLWIQWKSRVTRKNFASDVF